MATKLISVTAPEGDRERTADVVFVREDESGRRVRVQACYHRGLGSWEQWGAHTEVLSENVPAVEALAEGVGNAYATEPE